MYLASGLTKRYGQVCALAGVDLAVRRGEVHALLGANGAGKSTLVKALVGAHAPTSGLLELDGRQVQFRSVREANAAGVAYVSQELSLFPDLDVLSNLCMMREPTRVGVVSRRRMRDRALPVLERIGLDVGLGAPVGALRLGDQHLVEIARALLLEPKVLVLDEPTSSLHPDEVKRLLGVIGQLRRGGAAILYVSHFLQEVFSVADRITVLRDGRAVADSLDPTRSTIAEVTRLITGDAPGARVRGTPRPAAPRGGAADSLLVSGLAARRNGADVSFEARAGEILGLAGLEGAGQQDVMNVLRGAMRPTAGEVRLPDGQLLRPGVVGAVRRGVAYVPGDRRAGLLTDKSVWENIAMVAGLAQSRAGRIWSARRHAGRARQWIDRLQIASAAPGVRVASLSGGNQQKVLLAMWLSTELRVLLLDDPTRGVDVGAKAEIHQVVREAADAGRVAVLSSTDVEELAALCDRVLVFFGGRVTSELAGASLTATRILEAINVGSSVG